MHCLPTSGTSKELIHARIHSDRGHAEFRSWKEKEKAKAIGDCGLAKYKYGNSDSRNRILGHLSTTDLPLCPDQVKISLKHIRVIFVSNSTPQQLAYLLLTHLADGLTPEPEPVPAQPIMTPPRDLLANHARLICWSRISDVEHIPPVYRSCPHLWQRRRAVWSALVETLGSEGGIQTFVDSLAAQYVTACNRVLATLPNKKPEEIRVALDDIQFNVDETLAPDLFVTAWNNSTPADTKITEFREAEWYWLFHPLTVACRHALAYVVRHQFDDLTNGDNLYKTDTADARHTYYCVGVVWRSVQTHFSKNSRVKSAVDNLFLTRSEAEKKKLPVQEVNARTFKSLLYADRSTFNHFQVIRMSCPSSCLPHASCLIQAIRNKYRSVIYYQGQLCVKDCMVLRKVTEVLLQDKKEALLESFVSLTHFHPDDVSAVYRKYVYRVETLFGHDVARQYMDKLAVSKDNVLESLRAVKVIS